MPSIAIERKGGAPMQAYLSAPDRAGKSPGLVIIHEIGGLDAHTRGVADRFSSEGYTALAVDLFSTANRAICMLRIFSGILIRPLTNGVVGDLRIAIDTLAGRPEVDATRVGVIGFCMGGSYALQLACVDGRLKSASIFYGQNPRPLAALAKACPIVGSYPERDFTARQARRLESALGSYNIRRDIKIYPGARHSFFNDTRGAYDASAAVDAWARTIAFFKENLS
jgi:carboxymethylenebutenolidase